MPYEFYWAKKVSVLIRVYPPDQRKEFRRFFEARVLHYFSKKGGSCSAQEAERKAHDDLERMIEP